MDLSDDAILKAQGHRAFMESMAASRVLLKCASHLLQRRRGFDVLRDAILHRAITVVQDETGLRYEDLNSYFEVRLFGRFSGSLPIFGKDHDQRALLKAYRTRTDIMPMPSRFGYHVYDGDANLQYGYSRRDPPITQDLK